MEKVHKSLYLLMLTVRMFGGRMVRTKGSGRLWALSVVLGGSRWWWSWFAAVQRPRVASNALYCDVGRVRCLVVVLFGIIRKGPMWALSVVLGGGGFIRPCGVWLFCPLFGHVPCVASHHRRKQYAQKGDQCFCHRVFSCWRKGLRLL